MNTIKIVFTGADQTGKTALLKRYISNENVSKYKMTIGLDTFSKKVIFNNCVKVLQFVEIAGKRQFDFMRSENYNGASIVGLVIDATRPDTITRAREIFTNEILLWIRNGARQPKKVVLIVNKIDQQWNISKSEIIDFVNYMNQQLGDEVGYFEVSALRNIGLEKLFQHIINLTNM